MPEKAPRPVPEGMHTVTTHLWFNGNGSEAVEFYQKAFGAELAGPVATGPGGKGVMHALLKLGDSHIMVADTWPGSWEQGPQGSATAGLWVYVDDCDALFARAVEAGCESIMAPMDAFWGDRMGKVKDPFGHGWAIATSQWVLTPEEIQQRFQEWMASMQQ
jgi:PhnB protein